jgi:hypothetical protein
MVLLACDTYEYRIQISELCLERVRIYFGKNALSISHSFKDWENVCVATSELCIFRAQLRLRTFLYTENHRLGLWFSVYKNSGEQIALRYLTNTAQAYIMLLKYSVLPDPSQSATLTALPKGRAK